MPNNASVASNQLSSLERIPSEVLGNVNSCLSECESKALSLTSKTIYRHLLQNSSSSTMSRRARAIDYRLFSLVDLPLMKESITLPLLKEVKPQFIPAIVLQSNEAHLSSRKKSLLFALLMSSEQVAPHAAHVLVRVLPVTVREIITIKAINFLCSLSEIQYTNAKIYLHIIIAGKEARLPYDTLKNLILSIKKLDVDIPKKYKSLLCQAIASYIKVFKNSLESTMPDVSKDSDVIKLFKKHNLYISEITVEVLENLMICVSESRANATADKFIPLLGHADESVGRNASSVLRKIASHVSSDKANAFFDKLIPLLGYADASVRSDVLSVLSQIVLHVSSDKANAFFDKFIPLLGHAIESVGRNAFSVLSQIALHVSSDKANAFFDKFIPLLDQADASVKSNVLFVFSRIAIHVSSDKANAMLDKLIPLLGHADESVRSNVLSVLIWIAIHISSDKANAMLDKLIPLLGHADESVRSNVFSVLGLIASHVSSDKANAIADKLTLLFGHADENVRVDALFVLILIGLPHATSDKTNAMADKLLPFTTDSDMNVRAKVFSVLNQLAPRVSSDKTNAMADKLIPLLDHADASVRANTFFVLGRIAPHVSSDKANAMANKFIPLLDHADANVRSNVLFVLSRIAPRVSNDKANAMVDKLISLPGHVNVGMSRPNAFSVLSQLAPHVSSDKANAIADKLITLLDDANQSIKTEASRALGEIGMYLSGNSAKQLIKKMDECNAHTKKNIITALCNYFIDPKTSVGTVLLNDSPDFIQRCLVNGDNLFYILYSLLNDKSAVPASVKQLRPEAYGTFISKVITRYKPERGHSKKHKSVSSELNGILLDKSVTPEQKMEMMVRHVWQEKNSNVFFGTGAGIDIVKPSSIISLVMRETMQEVVRGVTSAI